MPDLPPDIISDILSRLPVKPILRFRCVSKPWRSLIDRKHFAKLHLRRSLQTNSNRTLLIDYTDKDIFSVDYDSFEPSDFGKPPFHNHIISNSVNGLVLAVSDMPFLWNPSTRKYKILPPAPLDCSRRLQLQVCVIEFYGFGYDSKSDDYKVVRVTEVGRARGEEYLYSEAKVYSLKSNSWKRIDDFEYTLPSEKRVWGVWLNDALHTVVNHCEHVRCIKAFDLGTYKNYEVPMPDITGVSTGVTTVDVMNGCLTTLVGRKMNTTEVWLMKEYGVKESWVKLLSFMPLFPEPYGYLAPLTYYNREIGGNEEVLINYDGRYLVAYNLREKRGRIVDVPGITPQVYGLICRGGSSFHAEICVGSLVSLDSPEEARKKPNLKGGKNKNKKKDEFLSAGFKLKL